MSNNQKVSRDPWVSKSQRIFRTFTKSLAQILSRDISFYDIVATQKGYFNTITLTITLAINSTLTPTLTPTLTLTQAVKSKIFVSLACHVEIFLPYVMWGDSESASKNTSIYVTRKFSELVCCIQIILKNLGERFSESSSPEGGI